MAEAVKVVRYGQETWEEPDMDAARKVGCLCLRCAKLNTVDPKANCPMAAVFFALCQTKAMAMGVSRCSEFAQK